MYNITQCQILFMATPTFTDLNLICVNWTHYQILEDHEKGHASRSLRHPSFHSQFYRWDSWLKVFGTKIGNRHVCQWCDHQLSATCVSNTFSLLSTPFSSPFPFHPSFAPFPSGYTGWVRLIRSHSSAGFCFELSGNSNYNINLLLYPLICDQVMSISENKLRN